MVLATPANVKESDLTLVGFETRIRTVPVSRPCSPSDSVLLLEDEEEEEESGMVMYGSLSWIVNHPSVALLLCRPIMISVCWTLRLLLLSKERGVIVVDAEIKSEGCL